MREDPTRTESASDSSTSGQIGAARPLLHAVAQIAAALATGDAPAEVLPGVLERVADTVGASSVSLWLGGEGELRCEVRVGGAVPTATALRAELASPTATGTGFIVVRLDAAHRPLGRSALVSERGEMSPPFE